MENETLQAAPDGTTDVFDLSSTRYKHNEAENLHTEDEKLSALTAEIAALQSRRLDALAEIGEKVLPELEGRPEYGSLTAEITALAGQIAERKAQEAALIEEKARLEKEEKEKLARRTCLVCKTVNPEGAQFCEECGLKLGELPREYCKACGTMNSPGMKFCGECGTKLGETA